MATSDNTTIRVWWRRAT